MITEGHQKKYISLKLPEQAPPPAQGHADKLNAIISRFLSLHPEERRAKAVKLENYALCLERAAVSDEEFAALDSAAAGLRALAEAIRP